MIGYVYILLNPAYKGLLKIGMTIRTPQERALELSQSTGVPVDFVVAYDVIVRDCELGEKMAHSRLADFRYAKEFFKVDLKIAIQILIDIEKELPLPEAQIPDTDIQNKDNEKYVDNIKPPNERKKDDNLEVNLNNYYSKIYFRNGLQLYKKHNYEGAIVYFDNAIGFNNKFSDAYYYRAICFLKIRDYVNAISDLNLVISKNFSYSREAKKLKNEIDNLITI